MGTGYVFFEILRPEDLSYTYKLNPAAFSVPWNMTTSIATLVLADPPCGCGALKNYEDIEGNIAPIERGDCSFTSKAIKAQEAGAAAAIITDNNDANDELYVSMIDDTTERSVDIPTAYLLGKNGYVIAHTLRRHKLNHATIRIPINITSIALSPSVPYRPSLPGGGGDRRWRGRQLWERHLRRIQPCTCRSRCHRQEQQRPRHTW